MPENSKNILVSTLNLVDLAGSERIKKSFSSGERLNEAKSINLSLTVLGKCIHILSEPNTTGVASFIPFRESKLTRLLKHSFGGNCKTVLIVTIGPCVKYLDESVSSLNFGMRAMRVKNEPKINMFMDHRELAQKLQAEIDSKDEQIEKLEISQGKLLDLMKNLKKVRIF